MKNMQYLTATKKEPRGTHGIDYQLNRFGLTWEQECQRSFLALNVWGLLDRVAKGSTQRWTSLAGTKCAIRWITNGSGSVTLELTEYPARPENNIPGGPVNANVYARLIMCRDILAASKWIDAEESKWMTTENTKHLKTEIMKLSTDTENFLTALLWAYPENDEGINPMEEKTVYDFSPEFVTAVSNFCEAFRAYLYPILPDEQFAAIDDCPRSFGGNVYFSLSGHGVGFWDTDDTEHLQPHLEAFSGSKYRFENVDLSEDENGKLDLSFIPSALPEYRRKMFTPAIATHSAFIA